MRIQRSPKAISRFKAFTTWLSFGTFHVCKNKQTNEITRSFPSLPNIGSLFISRSTGACISRLSIDSNPGVTGILIGHSTTEPWRLLRCPKTRRDGGSRRVSLSHLYAAMLAHWIERWSENVQIISSNPSHSCVCGISPRELLLPPGGVSQVWPMSRLN